MRFKLQLPHRPTVVRDTDELKDYPQPDEEQASRLCDLLNQLHEAAEEPVETWEEEE